MADPRDKRIRALEQQLREYGEIIARQQTLLEAQKQIIEELQRRLAERDAEQQARVERLQAEVERLEHQLLGPKTERTKVPRSTASFAGS